MKKDEVFQHISKSYEFNFVERTCLDITTSITLDRKAFIDKDYFDYFFAYRLSKLINRRIDEFLEFVIAIHFYNNRVEFNNYLTDLIESKDLKKIIGVEKVKLLISRIKKQKPSPYAIAYAIYFEIDSSSMNAKGLIQHYCDKYGENVHTVKKYYYEIRRISKDTDHKKSMLTYIEDSLKISPKECHHKAKKLISTIKNHSKGIH